MNPALRADGLARRVAASCALLALLAVPAPGPALAAEADARLDDARSLVDLLRRTEARYRGIGPFTLAFVQSYESPSFGVEESDRGTILVDPPDRMLWEYVAPVGQRAVMDGPTWWLVEPEFRQVTRRDRQPGETDPIIDLLAGRLDLLRVFAARPSVEPPGEPGRAVVELVPREPRDDVEIAIAEIDPRTADLRRLVVIDPLGSRYEMRLGPPSKAPPPPAARFDVDVPEGWTLVRD